MTFEQLKVGDSASITKTFVEQDLIEYSKLSLDTNPIHLDAEYASKTIFGQRIVYGMLVASLISAVLANKLPGEGTIYLGQELKFTAPVFLQDTVTATLTVAELREDKKLVTLDCLCTKQDGTKVIVGKSVVKFDV